jgi:hypothetical protein
LGVLLGENEGVILRNVATLSASSMFRIISTPFSNVIFLRVRLPPLSLYNVIFIILNCEYFLDGFGLFVSAGCKGTKKTPKRIKIAKTFLFCK